MVVAVVLVVLFLLKKNNSTSSTSSNITSDEESTFAGSMKDLIASGKSQKCSYTNESGSGMFYISSVGDFRGDLTSAIEGVSTNSHIIVTDNTSYYWSDGQSTGMKIVSEDNQIVETEDIDTNSYSVTDMDSSYTYKCNVWILDSSKFNLPDDVDFQSIDEMMGSYGIEIPSSE